MSYGLVIAVDPVGSGWTDPPVGPYYYGVPTMVYMTAYANIGNDFEYWEDEMGGRVYFNAVQILVDKPDDSRYATAHFKVAEVTQHTLTVAVDPLEGGWTEPPVGSYSYGEGTIVILDAFAFANYEFEYWEDNAGNKIYDPTIQVTMSDDYTVTAHFKPTTTIQHTLTVEIVGLGSVSPGSGVFNDGDVVQLTAYPETGWKFDRWDGADDSAVNPTTVTMDRDKLVVAVFVEGEEPEEPSGIDLSSLVGMMMIIMMMGVVMGEME